MTSGSREPADDSRNGAETGTAGDKPLLGATVEAEVRGSAGTTAVVARVDTGAKRASIGTGLAADVGAGPITGETAVRSAGRTSSLTRPVVDIVVDIDGRPHVVAASVEDRSRMRFPLLLGRDVLEGYRVDPGLPGPSADGGDR